MLVTALAVTEVTSDAFFIPKFSFLSSSSSSSPTRQRHTNPRPKASHPNFRQVKAYGGNKVKRRPNYPPPKPSKLAYRKPVQKAPVRQPFALAQPPATTNNFIQQPQKLDYSGWTPIGFDENAPVSSQSSKYQVTFKRLESCIKGFSYQDGQ